MVHEHTFVHDSNQKGAVAEAGIAFHAMKLGIEVLKPAAEHGRYDLAFDLGERILRVQCKWGALDRANRIVVTRIRRSRHTPRGYVLRTYSEDEIDAVAIYCGELDRCYLIPITEIAGQGTIHLRLGRARNAQRAALNWADDYDLGAVAQLERAPGWHPGGRGFESRQLHSSSGDPGSEAVGAHEFRNHFGWYMERAAAGEEILITRRGKPHARLGPPPASQP
jgi:prevent-host-death family protein